MKSADGVLEGTLEKVPTGIAGLDEVTRGGFPKGRPTLVCGSAGSGKTLLAMEFLVRGATDHGEPGLFIAFEETAEELAKNVQSLGFEVADLVARKLIDIDYVHVDRSEIEETGEFDLEGLFVRLGFAIDSIGAKRVVIDTIEVLFSGLSNTLILRDEISRLFRWLKKKGVTAVITAERAEGTLTRHGLEEYVSDCVILLDHRVHDQISTRRLRVVKYRGTAHDTNEFPFLIDNDGISVVPITAAGLTHEATDERISTGIAELDSMFDGGGYLRGSSVLISGTAGTGKTSLGAHFAEGACERGERCLYFSFEESPKQLLRNMQSIGINLGRSLESGKLKIYSSRPTRFGLEMHLVTLQRLVREFNPTVVVVDPISNFLAAGTTIDAHSMLVRLIDLLKARGITTVLTNLTHKRDSPDEATSGISSIIDAWIWLEDFTEDDERRTSLAIVKARGLRHSRKIRNYKITSDGVKLAIERGGEATT